MVSRKFLQLKLLRHTKSLSCTTTILRSERPTIWHSRSHMTQWLLMKLLEEQMDGGMRLNCPYGSHEDHVHQSMLLNGGALIST